MDHRIANFVKIGHANAVAVSIELIQIAKLNVKQPGLELIQAGIGADDLIIIALFATIKAIHPKGLIKLGAVGGNGTAVTKSTKIF
jgi:hypothetical protein